MPLTSSLSLYHVHAVSVLVVSPYRYVLFLLKCDIEGVEIRFRRGGVCLDTVLGRCVFTCLEVLDVFSGEACDWVAVLVWKILVRGDDSMRGSEHPVGMYNRRGVIMGGRYIRDA